MGVRHQDDGVEDRLGSSRAISRIIAIHFSTWTSARSLSEPLCIVCVFDLGTKVTVSDMIGRTPDTACWRTTPLSQTTVTNPGPIYGIPGAMVNRNFQRGRRRRT